MSPNNSEEDQISVNRAKLDSITLYEITEDELDTIERGSPTSNYLNFSLVLLSAFASFLTNLLLTDIQGKVFTIFVVITAVTFIAGAVLLIMWRQTNKDSKKVFEKIRSRKNVSQVRAIVDEENDQPPSQSEGIDK